MTITSMAATAQQLAESLMVDACRIERPNPADFTGPPLVIYSGKCRVKMLGRSAADQIEVGGMSSDEHRCRVDIPVSAAGVQFNDHVTVTSSISPSLLPLDVFVADIATVTAASAQRLLCRRSLR